MKPNRSVQLMLTVRVTTVNASASDAGAASQDSHPKYLILNDKNVAAASFT
jgi:hypothetical protein